MDHTKAVAIGIATRSNECIGLATVTVTRWRLETGDTFVVHLVVTDVGKRALAQAVLKHHTP